jgi:hypothetical protein
VRSPARVTRPPVTRPPSWEKKKRVDEHVQMETAAANKKLSLAVFPQRSLLFYTLTTTLPIVAIVAALLLSVKGSMLAGLATLCALVSLCGFIMLLYELTYDIAGYPEYKLPIWSVFYLLVYLISGFTFVLFALNRRSPGHYFGGVATTDKEAFLDALYISMSNYIGVPPDPSISFRTQSVRFLAVGQGLLSMFLNIVIITKFVSSF